MDNNEISEFLHSMAKANGRCFTDAQKEEFMTKLLELWKKAPALRFGQMLDNALGNPIDFFYVEDGVLLHLVEKSINEVY